MDEVATLQRLLAAGADSETARRLVETMHAADEQWKPDRAWAAVTREFLSPTHDFSLHEFLYGQCYGEGALLRSPGPAWFPNDSDVANANVTSAARELGLRGYPALHRWSVEHRPEFWEFAIQRLGIALRSPYSRVLDASQPTRPHWLVGATINIVDSCLQGDPDKPAILESDGVAPLRTTTFAELKSLVARIANGLIAAGIQPGDAVAMICPLSTASVATYLAVIAAGAAVVSIPDSFAGEEIATRLRISEAKLVVTQDVIAWGAKALPLYEKVKAATTLPIVIIHAGGALPLPGGERAGVRGETSHVGTRSIAENSSQTTPSDAPRFSPHPASPLRGEGPDGSRGQDVAWSDFLSDDDHFSPVPRSPQDTINILFSSGTTGEPKAIPWDHTTPIKCAVDGHFHHDLHAGDIACWPTNLGWMMGPWLIFATLINRAAIAIYGRAPHERGFGQFVQNAGVTMLGGVPSLVRAWRSTDCMKGLDWSRIRAFSSSGECSNAADQLYLMHLAGYRPVIEYCGGTEIGGAYLSSTVVQPNTPATFTTPTLGIDVRLVTEDGVVHAASEVDGSTATPSITGESFLVGPSIGLSTRLLNRDHETVYFADAPTLADGTPLRRHGDELTALPGGEFRVAGRSDDTMNLGGIKVGCAEIERVLTAVAGVAETAAVAVAPPGGGPSRLIVFTVAKAGDSPSADSLKAAMQQAIRSQLNPLFRVEEVRLLPSLPRTASNKVMRRELRALLK